MNFDKDQACDLLGRTPAVLRTLLSGLNDEWILSNEGPDTFSPFDVVGHLINGEKTDWRVRADIILSETDDKTFAPFDRFAQAELSRGKSLSQLLDEFEVLRMANLQWLRSLTLSNGELDRTGIHPVLGVVSLRQLLSSWVVHDLTHIAQITRVMAKQYKLEIGPWTEFFRILEF